MFIFQQLYSKKKMNEGEAYRLDLSYSPLWKLGKTADFDVYSLSRQKDIVDFAIFCGWDEAKVRRNLIRCWDDIRGMTDYLEKMKGKSVRNKEARATGPDATLSKNELAVKVALAYLNEEKTGIEAEYMLAIELKEGKMKNKVSKLLASSFQLSPGGVAGVLQNWDDANALLRSWGKEPFLNVVWNRGWDGARRRWKLVEKLAQRKSRKAGDWIAGPAWKDLESPALAILYAAMRAILDGATPNMSHREKKEAGMQYNRGAKKEKYADHLIDGFYAMLTAR